MIPVSTRAGVLETVTCSRCGGGGEYSYCQSHGTRCFKCGGKGVTLSKRGAAAARFLADLRSKPASAVAVGDTIKVPGVTVGGGLYDAWATVTKVTPVANVWAHYLGGTTDGVPHGPPAPEAGVEIETAAATVTLTLTDVVRVRPADAAEAARTLALAVAYQDTLTQAGVPKKKAKGVSRANA